MVFGLPLSTYTEVHVVISLVAIATGLVVVYGLITGKRYDGLTAVFLATTIATTVTGFFFPIHGFTPALAVGGISAVILLIALVARYVLHLAGPARWVYVVTAMIALYLNSFVAVVQAFRKIGALHALAPKGNEPPFAAAQIALLVLFIVLGVLATKKFRVAAVA